MTPEVTRKRENSADVPRLSDKRETKRQRVVLFEKFESESERREILGLVVGFFFRFYPPRQCLYFP